MINRKEQLINMMENGFVGTANGSPARLNYSLGKKLEDYQIYGNSKQSNLPDGYTQVEYVEGNGTQYFDSGLIANENISVEMKYALTLIGTTSVLYGARTTATTNNYSWHYTGSFNIYQVGFNNYRTSDITGDLLEHTIYQNKNLVYFDNELITTMTPTTFSTPNTVKLLAMDNNGTVQWMSNARLYYCKMWDNGTLLREFIPCYRNSDNVAGMYDIVNNVFYTNQGTGTFVIGTICPTPIAPIEVKSLGETTKNLYNADDVLTLQKNSNDTYTVLSVANNKANAVPIYLKANVQYTWSVFVNSLTNGNISIRLYNEAGTTIISSSFGVLGLNRYQFTVDANGKYYALNGQQNVGSAGGIISRLMIEESSVATPYVPYHAISVIEQGKNIIDFNDMFSGDTRVSGGITFTKEINGIRINGSTEGGTSSTGVYSIKDKLEVGKTYTASVNVPNVLFIFQSITGGVSNWAKTKTITGNETAINIWIQINPNLVIDNVLYEPQLEEGRRETPYEPYQEPIETTIDLSGHEPLRKIEDIADYIDYENQRIVRNIYKINLADYTWRLQTGTYNFYFIVASSAPQPLSSEYRYTKSNILVGNNIGTSSYNIGIAMFVSKIVRARPDLTEFPTLQSWADYINTHQCYLYYPLETPIYEPLTLPEIETLKGTVEFSASDELLSSSDNVVKYRTNVL